MWTVQPKAPVIASGLDADIVAPSALPKAFTEPATTEMADTNIGTLCNDRSLLIPALACVTAAASFLRSLSKAVDSDQLQRTLGLCVRAVLADYSVTGWNPASGSSARAREGLVPEPLASLRSGVEAFAHAAADSLMRKLQRALDRGNAVRRMCRLFMSGQRVVAADIEEAIWRQSEERSAIWCFVSTHAAFSCDSGLRMEKWPLGSARTCLLACTVIGHVPLAVC